MRRQVTRPRVAGEAEAGPGPSFEGARPPLEDVARLIGNRAFAGLARSLQPGVVPERRADGPVMQRMLIQLGNEWAEQENARRLRDSDPSEYRLGEVAALRSGEVLHLVAHAGGDDFGGKSPDDLFKWLVASGLPLGIAGVQLHGCESAGFATQLETLLNTATPDWTPTRTIPVRGVPGYHFVTSSGTSYSAGATMGDAALWSRIGAAVKRDPSDANIERLASQHRAAGRLVKIDVLKSSAAALRAMRQAVKQQLEADGAALARPQGALALEHDEIAGLRQRVGVFARLAGAPGAAGGAPVIEAANAGMAERALLRALEVLDHAIASSQSKELKPHLRTDDARDSLGQLREARNELRASLAGLPASVAQAAETLDGAESDLATIKDSVTKGPGASPVALRWVRGFASRMGSATELLRQAELDPVLRVLRGVQVDEPEPDVPPPSTAPPPPPGMDVPPPSTAPPPPPGMDVPPPSTAPPPPPGMDVPPPSTAPPPPPGFDVPPPSTAPPAPPGMDVPPPSTAPPPPPGPNELDLDELAAGLAAETQTLAALMGGSTGGADQSL